MRKNPAGRLELTWMGKDAALIPIENGRYDYAWVDRNDPRAREVKSIEAIRQVGDVDGPTGAQENLLIVGDSGDALRSLGQVPEYAAKYRGKVKLVYIDPPFNTGGAFAHYPDQLEHSIWLTMMRDRIRSIKQLLSPDASIWVHLDDSENHRMRLLLDEEFGADNFVAEVIWQKADSTRNDSKRPSNDHDTLYVYRNSEAWMMKRLPRTTASDARFTNPDDDPVGRWWDDNPTAAGARSNDETSIYAIQHPITGVLMYPPVGRHWVRGAGDMLVQMQEWASYELREIDDAARRASIRKIDPSQARRGVRAVMLSVPVSEAATAAKRRYEQGRWPRALLRSGGSGGLGWKAYIPDRGLVPSTWWPHSDVGHNRAAKAEIKALFGADNMFDTPKPESLIERILTIGSEEGDLVLDCFAGSGTTASVAHKMKRRWVTVELQHDTAQRFVVPRLTRVVEGRDLGGASTKTERVAADGVELPDGMTPSEAQAFNTTLRKVAEHVRVEIDVFAQTTAEVKRQATAKDPILSPEESATLLKLLRRTQRAAARDKELQDARVDVMHDVARQLAKATKTRDEVTTFWTGGGGFTIAQMGPSMYEVDDTDGQVYLTASATNGRWSKAVAGQLGFTLTPEHPVFCGRKGRQRLAVIDGVMDEVVVDTVLSHLQPTERAVVVAKAVLPEAVAKLQAASPGSRIRRAPDDLFPRATVK